MRLLALFISLASTVLFAEAALHQLTRSELVARHKYPELYSKSLKPRTSGAPLTREECEVVPSPWNYPECLSYCNTQVTKRDVDPTVMRRDGEPVKRAVDELLSPRDMAGFLRGRGKFTTENGTRYVDDEYITGLEFHAARVAKRSWHAQIVRDTVGKALFEHTMPFLSRWISHNLLSDDQVLAFSSRTGIRVGDLPALGKELLDDPEFTEIQIGGVRFTRKTIRTIVDTML